MIILRPDAPEALAAAQVVDQDLKSLVFRLHLREADRRSHCPNRGRVADQRLSGTRLSRVVQAQHEEDDPPVEPANLVPTRTVSGAEAAEAPAANLGKHV